MSQAPFQKFTAKKKNSVIKEEFRQEKKKYRKERNAFFDQKKEEEYQARIASEMVWLPKLQIMQKVKLPKK